MFCSADKYAAAIYADHQILCMLKHVKDYLRHLRHALIYTVFDGMVGKP